jgi:hypothetical protein
MSRNFAVVLNQGAEAHFLPVLAAQLRKVDSYHYFLAKEIDPNGPFFNMILAQDKEAIDQPGIELHVHHHMILYVLAAEDVSQIGFR